jgi:hypothetical protein
MKIVFAIVVLIVFALSFVADYKWRRWMAKRRAEQNRPRQQDRL